MIDPDASIHPLAAVDPDATVGAGTRVWQYSVVLGGATIGAEMRTAVTVTAVVTKAERTGWTVWVGMDSMLSMSRMSLEWTLPVDWRPW